MSALEISALLGVVAKAIAGRELDDALADHLNATFPVHEKAFQRLCELCKLGMTEGWLLAEGTCAAKPDIHAVPFSHHIVRAKNVRRPIHVQQIGEIGAIMPGSGEPKFDGKSGGWYVFPPGFDHHPKVSGGEVDILCLLPNGTMDFTSL